MLPRAKVVLADDRVLVGTTNLDAWALYRNWEVGLLFEDAAVAETVHRELFDRDVAASRPADIPTNLLIRARNRLLSLISPLLWSMARRRKARVLADGPSRSNPSFGILRRQVER